MQEVGEAMIKDSGTRREFETGAVRDIQEGKGRCDLLPLDVIAECFSKFMPDHGMGSILADIYLFTETGNIGHLYNVVAEFAGRDIEADNLADAFLEVAIHFEEGAKKYGEYNWQKGIPTHCYIDSAVRHYLKFIRGDEDERHDRAFIWNILCCIWTCIRKPELNDYKKEEVKTNEIHT
jgi:hypothetical protein